MNGAQQAAVAVVWFWGVFHAGTRLELLLGPPEPLSEAWDRFWGRHG